MPAAEHLERDHATDVLVVVDVVDDPQRPTQVAELEAPAVYALLLEVRRLGRVERLDDNGAATFIDDRRLRGRLVPDLEDPARREDLAGHARSGRGDDLARPGRPLVEDAEAARGADVR